LLCCFDCHFLCVFLSSIFITIVFISHLTVLFYYYFLFLLD
jgi:hypothetical protein